ncbi:MAG TPA: hypothetical protein VHF58_09090 [Solirubrobacterales bacterium]|nr:hypothetical protein [Solirubrobacterales bacterium]
MPSPYERRLPVGTTYARRGQERCGVQGCTKNAAFRIWSGTEFVNACEDHETVVARQVRATSSNEAH